MPALLAYLLSIAIFVGGAYASLVWLTEPVPSNKTASTASSTVARSHRPKTAGPIEEKQPKPDTSFATNIDKPDDAQGGDTSESVQKTVENEASKPASNSNTPEATKNGAAEPKQATQGSSGTVAKAGTERSDAPSVGQRPEAVADLSSSPPPSDTTQNNVVQRTGLPVERPPVSVRRPVAADASGSAKPPSRITKKPQVQPERDAKSDARSEGRTVQRLSDQHLDRRPDNQDKPQSRKRQDSSRSGLVLMTLRTIEFPDGHRERRLLPLRGGNDDMDY